MECVAFPLLRYDSSPHKYTTFYHLIYVARWSPTLKNQDLSTLSLRYMILHHLNIQFFIILSMWQGSPPLALEFF
jgi:hypothetical protein